VSAEWEGHKRGCVAQGCVAQGGHNCEACSGSRGGMQAPQGFAAAAAAAAAAPAAQTRHAEAAPGQEEGRKRAAACARTVQRGSTARAEGVYSTVQRGSTARAGCANSRSGGGSSMARTKAVECVCKRGVCK